MNLRLTATAEEDLEAIWRYLAKESPSLADQILDEIERALGLLLEQPKMGRERSELANNVRSWPTRVNYTCFYQLSSDSVIILRILHAARDFPAVL